VPATLPAYYINRTEVTVGSYAPYARERGLPAPGGDPALPVTQVSYHEAKAFCQWAGQRLPHPIEWEKAARGERGLLYPWGNDANPARANIASPQLLPAGAKRESASPYDVLDMAGNAWEWVDEARKPLPRNLELLSTRLQPPPGAREPWYSARGGSYLHPLNDARTFTFLPLPARYRSADLGFRCAGTAALNK
jgi:formylglycine-generating enzyme required for sulfatase activity